MTDRDIAATFAKGLSVLECFGTGQHSLTMADIARLTGFDRATTRRLCLTLEHSGYVYRDGKALRLSAKVLVLTGGFLTAQYIGRAIQPTLNQFAEVIEGEIALAVLEGSRALYVARSAVSAARLSLGLSVGSTLPLLPTAVGRMLLAQCESAEMTRILKDCSAAPGSMAHKLDRPTVLADIETTAKRGYAHVEDAFEMGAAGLAVPVPAIAQSHAVLSTTASTLHLSRPGKLETTVDILRQAARHIRLALDS